MTDQPPPHEPWNRDPQSQRGQQPTPPSGPPWPGYPAQGYPAQGYPAQGYGPYGGGPPPRSGRGKIVAICIAAVVVLGGGAFAAVQLAGGGGNDSAQTDLRPSPARSGGSAGSVSSTTCPALTGAYQTDPFQQSMTDAIESHNRAAFLALASTDPARTAMGLWWDNASAVGFTGGEAYADTDANLNDPGDSITSLTLDVALHNPFDVVDPGQYGKGILAPTTQYKIGIASVGAQCATSVTSWSSLSNTPLDVPEHLYVVHTKHTVVAGEPAMKSEVDRIAPIAEKAAVWDFGFVNATKGRHDNFLEQKGFVTYIPTSDAQAVGWFRAPTAPKPKGWTADAGNVAGTSFPLPGPNSSGTPKLTGLNLGQGAAVAGARVLLTKAGRSGSKTQIEGTLVHEYVHDILATDDIAAYLGGKPLSAATAEGAARWVESYFYSTPGAYRLKSSRAVPSLRPTIKANLGRFTGAVPTDGQIYGSSSLANFYYDLSASTFDYLAGEYGTPFTLQSVVDAYTNGGGPFSGIITNIKNGTITFGNPDTYQAKWAKWVRAGLPD
jgi:hypothetical protein